MKDFTLEDISRKFVQIIESQDQDKVRHWSKVLEKQKDPMITVEVFILIRKYLEQKDETLNRWFQEIYFEDYNPDVKRLWLNFVDLCSVKYS